MSAVQVRVQYTLTRLPSGRALGNAATSILTLTTAYLSPHRLITQLVRSVFEISSHPLQPSVTLSSFQFNISQHFIPCSDSDGRQRCRMSISIPVLMHGDFTIGETTLSSTPSSVFCADAECTLEDQDKPLATTVEFPASQRSNPTSLHSSLPSCMELSVRWTFLRSPA